MQRKRVRLGPRGYSLECCRSYTSISARLFMSCTTMSGWCGVPPKGRLRRSMNAVCMPADFAPMLGRLGVGHHVGLERISDCHRNHSVERNLMEGLRGLQHVRVAIREHHYL